MRLMYDFRASQPQKSAFYHGGSEYAKSILIELLKQPTVFVFVLIDSRKLVDDHFFSKLSGDFHLIDIKTIPQPLSFLNDLKLDRIFIPLIDNVDQYDLPKDIPTVITLHGLRAIEIKQDLNISFHKFLLASDKQSTFVLRQKRKIKRVFKNLIHLCKDTYIRVYEEIKVENHHQQVNIQKSYKGFIHSQCKVITVSNYSKYTIHNFLNLALDRIEVFYPPQKQEMNIKESLDYELEDYQVKNYFLIVSGNRVVKNALTALEAFSEIKIKHFLIVTGASKTLQKRFSHNQRIIFLDYVNETTLEYLYANAYALLYPSFNEGFGLPPIEAMKYGTPVVSSVGGAISEILGDSVLYFTPGVKHEIQNKLLQVINDKTLYAQLKLMSQERYKFIASKQQSDLKKLMNFLLEL